jgi:hypothetical protein
MLTRWKGKDPVSADDRVMKGVETWFCYTVQIANYITSGDLKVHFDIPVLCQQGQLNKIITLGFSWKPLTSVSRNVNAVRMWFKF